MTNLIATVILALIVGGAVFYIIRAKKAVRNVSAVPQEEAAPAAILLRRKSWTAPSFVKGR